MTCRQDGGSEASDALDAIAGEIRSCTGCRLCETRGVAVPGEGLPDASVMIVGEAPGRNEDETGHPFVGAAGKRLDDVIGLAGLSRTDVFIANVVRCRPPKNRNPRPDEIAACREFLDQQIAAIRPEVVVTLGNFATQLLLGTREGVATLHGRPVEGVGIDAAPDLSFTVYPVFHPAATIYRPQWRPVLEDDMRRLAEIVAPGLARHGSRQQVPPLA